MQRRRQIAAVPARSASETVPTINALLRETLAASPSLPTTEVDEALDVARPALLALVSGGHTDQHPLVLVAAVLHLSVTTVSGDSALTLDENLNPVPGASSATTWTLYLPTPDPLAGLVRATAKQHARLSAEAPPATADAETKATSPVDFDALSRRRD
jgi:hypothetical protein